ncbi:long-chain-fatty-acid--CoA ligase [Desulfonatronovibrio hydrogenovorans]|uniref:long-chain-fatty-acid--CoA ligase n=1 Tax=Desulfonatronovibrio hydrogenovorans TaxID=53245 RepID=UPI00048C4F9D|nr:long-chain fatty acid--CoA ligase [Desulfonatronovibrio hydrogenovorans]
MQENEIVRPWLSSYDQEVSPSLEYENIPVYEYMDRIAQKYPNRKAIVFNNWKITYKKLKELTETMAANLRSYGLSPGDRVAIMLPNLPQTIIAYWAVLKAGGAVVMTNPLYMEKEMLHHFTDSQAKFLITLDLLWPKISGLLPRFDLSRVFITRIPDCLRFPLTFLYNLKAHRDKKVSSIPYDNEKVIPWKKLVQKGEVFIKYTPDPKEDLAALQYTGGTTGVSKGVMLTHYNLAANVAQSVAILHKVGPENTVLGLLPYFHIYGLTVCINFATAIGATLAPYPRFVPREILKAIQKVKPTIFPCAPAVFMALLQQKDIEKFDLSSINYCISGSAPIPVEIIERFKKMTGAEIIEGYGLTEASPITHLNPLRGKRKIGSIGLPFPDTDSAIVDMELGTLKLPPGKIGELVIKGPQVMKGYWNRPDETAGALRNNWLYTGDIAYMDEEGYFYIVDRKKDLIITGGYNVYPREIDEVLHEHPKVKEAVSVGIPSETRGEVIKAFIVPQNGEKLTRSEIISFCREKLAGFKVPKQVEFRDELPKTIVGKVLRRALREEELEKIRKNDN